MAVPPPAVAALLRAQHTPTPPSDRLAQLRDAVRRVHAMEREAEDLEERTKAAKRALTAALQQELPDLFDEIGVRSVGLDAEGNEAAYTAEVVPYFHASIAADWPDDRRAEAFRVLREAGGEPLIRVQITAELDPGDAEKAALVRAFLVEEQVPHSEKLGVPWAALTAWVRERVRSGEGLAEPWETIGATVGRTVKIKEVKVK